MLQYEKVALAFMLQIKTSRNGKDRLLKDLPEIESPAAAKNICKKF